MKYLLPFFLLFAPLFLVAQNDDCPRPTIEDTETIYAGIDIGSVGIKPVVVQIQKTSAGRVSFRKVSVGLAADNSLDLSKDKSETMLDCYARRITEFVDILRGILYRVPKERIYLLMSAGFVDIFKNEPELLDKLKNKIREQNPGVSLEQLTEQQESEYIVRAVTMEDYLKGASVNIIDVGGRTTKGGYVDASGQVNLFSTKTGPSGLSSAIEKAIADNGWDVKTEYGRRNILEAAAAEYDANHRDKIKTSGVSQNKVVFGGGIVYVYTAWKKAQDASDKYFNQIFPFNRQFADAEAEYFASETVKHGDVKTLFEKGEGANSLQTYSGNRLWRDAQRIYKDGRLLAGAAILREMTKDLRRRGTSEFFFYNDMQFAHLYYHICLKERIMSH